MINRNSIIILILLVVTALMYAGCSKTSTGRNPCLEPRKYFLNLQTCVPADTGSAGVATNLPSAVVGYVDTPIVFYNAVSASDFKGPLSAIADSTRWFILPDTNNLSQVDTLTFYYERKPVFLSTACGYTFVFSLKSIDATNNVLDSVKIVSSEVTSKSDVVHVKVFY